MDMDYRSEDILQKPDEDQSSSDPDNQDDEEDDPSLDTAFCFLCLQKSSNAGGSPHHHGNDDDEELSEACILGIFRYLNINLDKYEDSAVVMLCATCASLCSQLTELIRKVELTNMVIQERLGLFNGILKESEPDELLEDEDDPDEVFKSTMELRQATTDESTIKLEEMMKNSLPKIKLSRTTAMKSDPSAPDSKCTSPKQWISNIIQKLVINRYRYRCPFCKIVVPEQIIRSHLLLGHPEKYFLQRNITNLPEETLTKICRQNIHKEIQTVKHELPGPKSLPRKNIFQCQHCDLKFNKEVRFKCHFILTHHNILEDNLFPLEHSKSTNTQSADQNTTESFPTFETASEKQKTNLLVNTRNSGSDILNIFSKFVRQVNTNRKGNENRFQCILCTKHKKLHAKNKLYNHLVYVHLEYVFQEKKFPKTSMALFKFCCRKVIAEESQHYLENKNVAPGKRGSLLFLCPFCPLKHPIKILLRYHLVLEHFDILGEKLARLQEMPPESFGYEDGLRVKRCKGVKVNCILKPEAKKMKLLSDDPPKSIQTIPTKAKITSWKHPKFKASSSSPANSASQLLSPSAPSASIKRRPPMASVTIGKRIARNYHKFSPEKRMIFEICCKLTKKLSSGDKIMCSLCNFTYPTKRSPTLFRRHIINAHPEQFFSSEKLNLTKYQINGYCRHAMVKENTILQKLDSSSTSNLCEICNRKFKGGHHDFRYHMIFEHYKTVESKLMKLGKGLTRGDQFRECEDQIEDGDIHDEEDTLEDENEDQLEDIESEPEIKTKPVTESPPKVSTSANSSSELSPHPSKSPRLARKYSKFPKEKQMIFDICWKLTKKLPDDKVQCSICLLISSSKKSLTLFRRHIVHCHPEQFFSQAKQKLNLTESHFKEYCRQVLVKERNKSVQFPISSGSYEKLKVCQICNRKFTGGHDFRHHMIFEHYKVMEAKLMRFETSEGLTLTRGKIDDPLGEGVNSETAYEIELVNDSPSEDHRKEVGDNYSGKVEIISHDGDEESHDNSECFNAMIDADDHMMDIEHQVGTFEAEMKLSSESVLHLSQPETEIILPDI